MKLVQRLYKRGWKYFTVGITAFFLDLGIIFALVTTTATPNWLAISIGFLIGISINYYWCYHWVYTGTERKFHHGYFYFISLALLGMTIISVGTIYLVEIFDLPLVVARTAMGAITGTTGFFINTFFNFRLL